MKNEHKEKLRKALLGNTNALGSRHKMSEAHKLKISKALSGKKKTTEHKNNISKNAASNSNYGMSGKNHSEDTRAKMSRSKRGIKRLNYTGVNHPLYGKKQSKETLEKRKSTKKKYNQIHKDLYLILEEMIGETYDSANLTYEMEKIEKPIEKTKINEPIAGVKLCRSNCKYGGIKGRCKYLFKGIYCSIGNRKKNIDRKQSESQKRQMNKFFKNKELT